MAPGVGVIRNGEAVEGRWWRMKDGKTRLEMERGGGAAWANTPGGLFPEVSGPKNSTFI